jgi:hypothetical protein
MRVGRSSSGPVMIACSRRWVVRGGGRMEVERPRGNNLMMRGEGRKVEVLYHVPYHDG